MPPGAAQPWPSISPFQQQYSRTWNQDGTWFNDSQGFGSGTGPGNWTFNIDFVRSQPRKLRGLVGAPNTLRYVDKPEPTAPGTLMFTPTDQQTEADGFTQTFDLVNFFDAADARAIGNLSQGGLKIGLTRRTATGSEFYIDIGYNPEASETYNPKNALANARYRLWDRPGILGNRAANEAAVMQLLTTPPPNQNATNTRQLGFLSTPIDPRFDYAVSPNSNTQAGVNALFQRNLYNLNGLPIQNLAPGQPVLDGNNPLTDPFDLRAEGTIGGVTVPYDILFKLEHRHESFNVGAGVAMSSAVQFGPLSVTPVFSGRYMYLGERFAFRGIDSGLNYSGDNLFKDHPVPNGFDDGGDGIIDNAGNGTGGDADPTLTLYNPNGLIRSRLVSDVQSNMAGPEFAVQYQLGEQGGVRVVGKSKVGLMVNRENIEVSGDNIGDHQAFDPAALAPDGGAPLAQLFPTNGTDNRFRDEKTTTHLSPLFEQTFQAEIPIFSQVPVLNRMRQFDGASLRLGYSWLWIGEVASPNRSILWEANPRAGLFPGVKLDREAYYISSWNFGVNWAF